MSITRRCLLTNRTEQIRNFLLFQNIKAPGFGYLQALNYMATGHIIADVVTIIGPIKFRKKILGQCKEYTKKKNRNIIFNIKNKKCFNGCRPPKKKRKKRKFKQY